MAKSKTSARNVLVGLLFVVIFINAGLRITGFDQDQFAHSVGGWVYSRQTAVLSNSQVQVVTDDVHSTNVDLLDLLSWEHDCLREGSPLIQSNETQRSKTRQTIAKCNPPKEVVLDCCEGTFASGSTVLNFAFQKCESSFADSEYPNSSLPTLTRQFLRDNPIQQLHHSMHNCACDVCQVLEHCRQNNLTVTFVGDSVQAQVWQGFVYELQRRNYNLTLQSNQTQSKGFWKTIVQYRETLDIQSTQWSPDESVKMKFFQVYKLPFQYALEMEEVVNSGDVLMLGWGLHWNSNDTRNPNSLPSAYISSLTDFLNFVQHNHTRPQLVVHREGSAQHFDAPAGDFYAWQSKPNAKLECQPISYDATLTNWREKTVQIAANKAGYQYTTAGPHMPPPVTTTPELVVLPFFNYTSHHHNQHPKEKESDCTHYCPSPFLYLPLWRSFRLTLDRQFPNRA